MRSRNRSFFNYNDRIEKKTWVNKILFYAHLIEDKIIIEDDNFEEGLTNILIKKGVEDQDIITETKMENILETIV